MMLANQQGQSHIAIRRFESGAYASDEAVYREYIRALALTNQLARVPLSQLGGSGTVSFGAAAYAEPGAGSGFGSAAAGSSRGSVDMPLHVQFQESTRSQMLRMLQRLAFFGLAAMGLMMFVDEKALPKGLGLSNDVQPVHAAAPCRHGTPRARLPRATSVPTARATRAPRTRGCAECVRTARAGRRLPQALLRRRGS